MDDHGVRMVKNSESSSFNKCIEAENIMVSNDTRGNVNYMPTFDTLHYLPRIR